MKMITDVIREVRAGGLAQEASEQMQRLVCQVNETGKPGEITLKLKVSPQGEVVNVEDSITVKFPKQKTGTIFFPSLDGDLTRSNTRQQELELQAVGGDAGTIQTVDPDTGEITTIDRTTGEVIGQPPTAGAASND